MADISSEWEGFGATVLKVTYQLPSPAQDEAGITPGTVVASVREWQPGANCPDGYVFADYSSVQATSLSPTSREDWIDYRKDDKVNPKDLKGNTTVSEWHQGVREDIAKVPVSNYKNRQVFINRNWDFNYQLEEIRKGITTIKIKKKAPAKEVPEWLRKAYNK